MNLIKLIENHKAVSLNLANHGNAVIYSLLGLTSMSSMHSQAPLTVVQAP